MATKEPPAFENAANCRKCNVAFGLITRKHHCRNCGKTYCNNCSKKEAPLPVFGFIDPACFDALKAPPSKPASSSGGAGASVKPIGSSTGSGAGAGSSSTVASSSTPASRAAESQQSAARKAASALDDDEPAAKSEPAAKPAAAAAPPQKKVSKCVCNMPFCICPPDKVEAVEDKKPEKKADKKEVEKPKAAAAPAKKTESAPSTFSGFSGFGGAGGVKYDLKGDLNEQIRDAIKAGDVAGVKQLLGAGADPKFVDRTGNTLVHLAALFNHESIVNILVAKGADVWIKNPSGETAVDLAQPSLGHKMKELCPKKSS